MLASATVLGVTRGWRKSSVVNCGKGAALTSAASSAGPPTHRSAAAATGIPWEVLAAVNLVETGMPIFVVGANNIEATNIDSTASKEVFKAFAARCITNTNCIYVFSVLCNDVYDAHHGIGTIRRRVRASKDFYPFYILDGHG